MTASAQQATAAHASGTFDAAARARPTMKAMVHDAYGSPDLLELRDIALPTIGDDEVLVRVVAAGLQVGDCFAMRGAPLPVRMVTGLFRPKYGVPGFDLAGEVEAVGRAVKRLQAGDEVFGTCQGACAEFAVAKEDQLAHTPAHLTLEQAAAVPTSALTALQGLRDAGKIRAGQKVLINGASGGVGTFAVQIAQSFGAQVTGVCSTANVDLVSSLGAEHVIDYTREDFTRSAERFDLILDNMENHSLSECRHVLTATGTLVVNSGTGARGTKMLVRLLKPLIVSPFVRQRLRRYVMRMNQEDLLIVKNLVDSGKLTPVIDRTFPLSETPAALRHIEGGHARGKVVVTLPPRASPS